MVIPAIMKDSIILRLFKPSAYAKLFLNYTSKNIFPINHFNQRMIPYISKMLYKTRQVNGCIVECGVGSGFSLFSLISNEIYLAKSLNKTPREFWAFDSFEGFPIPRLEDQGEMKIGPGIRKGRGWIRSTKSLEKKLENAKVDLSLIKLNKIRGFFSDTLKISSNLPASISLLHLDVDLFDSYELCLSTLGQRVKPGGIIMVDEYIDQIRKFPGAVKAINSFLSKNADFKISKDSLSGKYYMTKSRQKT